MEIDEHGRVVKRRPPPGAARDLPEAFPTFEHNQWTFEGEIERLGTFARALNRGNRAPRWLRYLLGGLVLLPFATALLAVTWNTVFG